MMWYKLDEQHNTISCDVTELDHDISKRRVAETTIGNYWVSTIFLGLDHGWGNKLALFETMITHNGKFTDYQERCATWDEAVLMHEIACGAVNDGSIKQYEATGEDK